MSGGICRRWKNASGKIKQPFSSVFTLGMFQYNEKADRAIPALSAQNKLYSSLKTESSALSGTSKT
jgi:hypothetical protein